jgi:YD repeat-containing protein
MLRLNLGGAFACRLALAFLSLACAHPVFAQTSYQWAQSAQNASPEWAKTWRNSPDEVAQAYCAAIGAPQPVQQNDGAYVQTCVAIPNSGHPWPAHNVKLIGIRMRYCIYAGGCQQSLYTSVQSQMVTRSVTPEFYVSKKTVPNLPSCSKEDKQGDPIVPSTCSVFSEETDIEAQAPAISAFKRYYNSVGPGSGNLSTGWFHSFGRRLNLVYQSIIYRKYKPADPDNSSLYSTPALTCESGFPQIKSGVPNWTNATASYSGNVCTVSIGGVPVDTIPILTNLQQNPMPSATLVGVNAIRDDGAIVRFLVVGGTIVAPTSVTLRLQQAGSGFALTDTQDNVESYDATGRLLSITSREGRVTTMGYDAQQRLATVTFPFGHALALNHDMLGLLTSVTDPGGRVVGYGYDSKRRLATVNNGDSTSRTYFYENASFLNALTGLIDESGLRRSTWAYDTQGRAISAEEAGGINGVTLVYNADGTVTSTDVLGAVRTFTFNR